MLTSLTRSRLLRFLLSAVLLYAASFSVTASDTILVLGDSLSAGFGMGREQSWPALLGQRLKSRYPSVDVANISISGETTAGGLSRLPEALRHFKPRFVIIVLGANDGLRGLPLPAMRANLAAMIRADRLAGARTLLVGMRLPPNYGLDYVRQFAQAYTDLAQQNKVPLVPFLLNGFAERSDAFQADGLHPTAAYQPAILDNIWPTLESMLKPQ
jgi:acyl-CoA thioesterase-1